MSASLAGRVAVITGAGRPQGLGFAIAARLGESNARVMLSDLGHSRDQQTPETMIGASEELQQTAEKLAAQGVEAASHSCDVRRPEEVQALAQATVEQFGRIDIWVNSAGIGYIMKPLLEVGPEDWQAVIDVNLSGCFYGLQAAARQMIRQGEGGIIINIASQAAKSGFPFAQAYCSSKHGLVGLVRSAAIELGEHQIRVNNVCPNHVTTGLGQWQNEYFAERMGKSVPQYMEEMRGRIPLGRTGLPADTAAVVAFLCSDEASYITAESINVSGGEEPH